MNPRFRFWFLLVVLAFFFGGYGSVSMARAESVPEDFGTYLVGNGGYQNLYVYGWTNRPPKIPEKSIVIKPCGRSPVVIIYSPGAVSNLYDVKLISLRRAGLVFEQDENGAREVVIKYGSVNANPNNMLRVKPQNPLSPGLYCVLWSISGRFPAQEIVFLRVK